MMKKTKRTLYLLLLLVLTLIINISEVKANGLDPGATFCGGGGWGNGEYDSGSGTGSGGGSGSSGPPSGPGGAFDCGDGLTANCWKTSSVSTWSNVYIKMYDMYGNLICDPLNASRCLENPILAGTYVGLDVYESKGYSLTVRTGAKGIQRWNNCKIKIPRTCYYYDEEAKEDIAYDCSYWDFGNFKGANCPGGWTLVSPYYVWATACTAAFQHCKNIAKPSPIMEINPSYETSYKDSNDIDEKTTDGKYKTSATVIGTLKNQIYSLTDSGWNWNLTEEKTFHYNRQKTCINVKNGKVRYVNHSDSCDSKEEYTIKSENGYWKYFIPLNANSAEGFSFTMHSSGELVNSGICKNIIDRYDNYASFIKPFAGTFNKIKYGDSAAVIKSKKADAKRLVQSGCYYETNVEIPITQRFYNEINSGQNFKGFNFYYRPIDINNPFPNGLTDTSLWYQWNKDPNQKPDITESFDEITYIANTSGNENIIRKYTDTHPYTNWYNMYINGTSSFIEKEGIVTRGRDFDRDSIYALGCGPKNTNVNNIFQQKECDD